MGGEREREIEGQRVEDKEAESQEKGGGRHEDEVGESKCVRKRRRGVRRRWRGI